MYYIMTKLHYFTPSDTSIYNTLYKFKIDNFVYKKILRTTKRHKIIWGGAKISTGKAIAL